MLQETIKKSCVNCAYGQPDYDEIKEKGVTRRTYCKSSYRRRVIIGDKGETCKHWKAGL